MYMLCMYFCMWCQLHVCAPAMCTIIFQYIRIRMYNRYVYRRSNHMYCRIDRLWPPVLRESHQIYIALAVSPPQQYLFWCPWTPNCHSWSLPRPSGRPFETPMAPPRAPKLQKTWFSQWLFTLFQEPRIGQMIANSALQTAQGMNKGAPSQHHPGEPQSLHLDVILKTF